MARVTLTRALRPLASIVAIALLASAAIAAASWGGGRDEKRLDAPVQARSVASRITTLDLRRLQQAPISWRGGPITTSTGETVNVLVSDSLPVETATPEGWAEFLVKLVHGPEIQQLTTYIAPLSEITQVCGSGALGCYTRNRSMSVGEVLPDGTTPEEVVRHEYGHHIALYRSNSPWRAIDWGPKRWASASNVCARVARGDAHPGDQGRNYERNPGEAWAEAYRLMDERKAGVATGRWQVVSSSFFPSEAALAAAEQDVVQPWAAPTQAVFRKRVGRGKTWLLPVATPLDGAITVSVQLPRGGRHETALLAPNRRTVLGRGSAVGRIRQRIAGTVCGQRSVYVRVVQRGAPGQVTVVASTP